MSARAMETLCFCPPDKVEGRCFSMPAIPSFCIKDIAFSCLDFSERFVISAEVLMFSNTDNVGIRLKD